MPVVKILEWVLCVQFEAELIMLRLDNESQAGQMAQQKLDLEARAAEVAVLRKEVHVLQAQDPIRLTLTGEAKL